MALPTAPSDQFNRSWTSMLAATGTVGTGACVAVLAGLTLSACRGRDEQHLSGDKGPAIAGGMQGSTEARMRPDALEPRTHARSHVLLGIDFSRPLSLPECARNYNSIDRPDRTCVYLRSLDHKPFKIEFRNGAVPDFVKWDNALVSTDARGRPDMLRFDVDEAPALRGKAVDAMLETFGPPTSVENAGGTPRLGTSKVGTWRHEDYVIQYVFAPGGGGVVQMETKHFHDASTLPATADGGSHAKR